MGEFELIRRYFDRIHEEGTDFAELDRIVDGLLLGPSHFSLGLQLADLVVVNKADGDLIAAARRAARAGAAWPRPSGPRG